MSSSKQTSGEELPLVAGQETGAPATPRRSLLIQFITAAISVVMELGSMAANAKLKIKN